MKRKGKSKINYIIVALVIVIVLLTIIRICSSTTKNAAFGISGIVDGSVQMVDACYLELELEAPMAGLTGFSFQFEGDRDSFKNAGFLVTTVIQNDPLNPQVLCEKEMPLMEQAYDYQNECYRVIVPFEGDIQQGDRLRIAIMGMGMSEEDHISVKVSSKSGIAGATFEINDYVQDDILAGSFYYQKKDLEIFPVLMQGIIFIFLVLLAGEVWKKPKRKKKFVERKQIPYKKQIIKLIPVIIFLIIALDYTYYAGIRPQIQNLKPADKIEVYPGKDAAFRELCDGEALFCQSKITENQFGGFGIYLKEPYDDNGLLTIEVTDIESQDLVTSAQKAIYVLTKDEGNFLKFNFDSPVKKSAGEEYLISIYYSGTEPIEFLTDGNGGNNPKLIPLYQKNIFLVPLFLILNILIIGFTISVFVCEQNRVKVEKLLFISIVFLGILFETVITPFAVPDEASHIDTAYRLSNQILGVNDSAIKDAIYKRECDIITDSGIKRTIDVESYKWLYDDWFNTEGSQNTRLIFAADNMVTTNALFFLPAAVGMTIGRILGVGFLPMIFLARTANLLLAVWLIYLAVKKLPFGKSVMCVIALLPITLQQIASCSYDALIIAVSMLYVSYCVFAIYSEKKLEKTDILVILITAVMLGVCKGGAYIPLYLLSIWVLVKRGYIRFPEKKGIKIAGIVVAVGIALSCIIGVVYIYRQSVDIYSLRNRYYPLNYLIQHPWETVRIFENTIYESMYSYIEQFLGDGLGTFQISLIFIVPIGYLMLMGVAVICSEKYSYIVNVPNKCVFLSTAALSIAAVYMAFLTSYTVFGSDVIGGVQGRYFIPVLWLLLICIRSGNIVNKKKRYRKIVTTGYLLGVCSVLQVIINTLGTIN